MDIMKPMPWRSKRPSLPSLSISPRQTFVLPSESAAVMAGHEDAEDSIFHATRWISGRPSSVIRLRTWTPILASAFWLSKFLALRFGSSKSPLGCAEQPEAVLSCQAADWPRRPSGFERANGDGDPRDLCAVMPNSA